MTDRVRPVVDISASCACGAISVTVRGPAYSMFLCSCEDCQRATGTGHAAVAIFDPNDVAITGETKSFDRLANSGATFTRHFCPTCGTPIYGRTSRRQDALMLPVGLFGREASWFAPSQLIFARSHRDWDTIAEGLPRHQTYRGALEEH